MIQETTLEKSKAIILERAGNILMQFRVDGIREREMYTNTFGITGFIFGWLPSSFSRALSLTKINQCRLELSSRFTKLNS